MGAPTDDAEDVALDLDAVRKTLLELKARFGRDLAIKDEEMSEEGDDLDPERGGVGNHMADEANDTTEEETTMALQGEAQQALDQVNRALARLDAGTYGTCANCGKKIPAARLKARPYAIYDIACQELADQGKI
ncbi:MAG TPA: TraR/DksA C4-type zinc finger protein [Chloroflexia bacterium]|nr:TraR/DksA C4-type zinc finger protein [Chloroflexia bacterium]